MYLNLDFRCDYYFVDVLQNPGFFKSETRLTQKENIFWKLGQWKQSSSIILITIMQLIAKSTPGPLIDLLRISIDHTYRISTSACPELGY